MVRDQWHPSGAPGTSPTREKSDIKLSNGEIRHQLAESRRQLLQQEKKLALDRALAEREKKLKQLDLKRELERLR